MTELTDCGNGTENARRAEALIRSETPFLCSCMPFEGCEFGKLCHHMKNGKDIGLEVPIFDKEGHRTSPKPGLILCSIMVGNDIRHIENPMYGFVTYKDGNPYNYSVDNLVYNRSNTHYAGPPYPKGTLVTIYDNVKYGTVCNVTEPIKLNDEELSLKEKHMARKRCLMLVI